MQASELDLNDVAICMMHFPFLWTPLLLPIQYFVVYIKYSFPEACEIFVVALGKHSEQLQGNLPGRKQWLLSLKEQTQKVRSLARQVAQGLVQQKPAKCLEKGALRLPCTPGPVFDPSWWKSSL